MIRHLLSRLRQKKKRTSFDVLFSFSSIGVYLNFIATDNSGGGREVKSHCDFADAKPQSKEVKERSPRSDAHRLCDRRGTSNLSFSAKQKPQF